MSTALAYKIPTVQLQLIVSEPEGYEPIQITDADQLSQAINPIRCAAEENFIAVHLNAQYEIIGVHEAHRGTATHADAHPREVFKSALLSNATAIIIAHNHPGGTIQPSDADKEITVRMIEVGKLMGVPVLDHVIVSSRKGYYSMRENLPQLWEME